VSDVTVAALVYRDARWIAWLREGLERMKTTVKWRLHVVANDPENQAVVDCADVVFNNDDPDEHYIRRVYRAWNEAVTTAPTQHVILVNSDMYPHNYAVDELVAAKRAKPAMLPCGLLVEHGRITSGMPEYARDFGTTPETFDRASFSHFADSVRRPGEHEPGRLFMPVLVDREEFLDCGGYVEGNVGNVSGDKLTFDKFRAAGLEWVTCLGSVWYHVQCGEMLDATKA
jgi:hypothetical protein